MRLCIILLISLFCLKANAQTSSEIAEISESLAPEPAYEYKFNANTTSELQLAVSGFFFMYKKYVSSQDASSCSFIPSCSVYAVEAIQKQGIFVGLANFFDRFSRCNGQSQHDYEFDHEHHLLIDPLTNIKHQHIK